jgi:hypothetical protein
VTLRTIILIAMGIVAYIVWAFMAWFDPSQRTDFLHFNIAIVTGIVGLVLRDMGTPGAPPPAP